MAELFSETATLIYFIITGYYFQPMPTNPYLLLSTDNDGDEDILFSVDAQELKTYEGSGDHDKSALLEEEGRQMTRRAVEELV